MGLLDWFRSRRPGSGQSAPAPAEPSATDVAEQWEEVPAFIDVDASEHPEVSVIATAVAAADRPESEFVVKRVAVQNPEFRTVTLIASAIQAGALEHSEFVVKGIYKKKTA